MKDEKAEFSLTDLLNATVRHENILQDCIIEADNEKSPFVSEIVKVLYDTSFAEVSNIVAKVAYKFDATDKDALMLIAGLHLGWRLSKHEIEITTAGGKVVKL